jgi:ABC-type ATPase involved in cell division
MIETLTYLELGDRLSISPEAARKKAKTAKWPIRLGNDGKARVSVDFTEIHPARRPAVLRPEEPTTNRVHELQAEVEKLRAALHAEGVRTAVLAAQLEAVSAERDRWYQATTTSWWQRLRRA